MVSWSDFKVVGRERKYLLDAFDSGWVSGGSYVEKLEESLANIFSGSHPLAVSNGTAALQLAFQILALKEGDEVIVPSFSFQAAANVLLQLHATPIFCDVDPLTWNQSVESISAAKTTNTVGVVVVHNYGMAAPIREIKEWANRNGIWVIEDCAEAWFTRDEYRFAGQYGSIGTFSMHATKTISCGEGGVVLINDQELLERAKLLRSHGLDRAGRHYFHQLPGNNYRLSNLLCAIAYAQLEQYAYILDRQRNRYDLYRSLLEGHWAISFQGSVRSYSNNIWAVAVSIDFDRLSISRDELLDVLQGQGVETRPGFYSASSLIYFQNARAQDCVSNYVSSTIVVLPCSSALTDQDIEFICDALIRIIDEHKAGFDSYDVVHVAKSSSGIKLIEEFDKTINRSRDTFRYFGTRDYSIILGHIATLILRVDGEIAGYGHIELHEGTYWLGLAISDQYQGYGWGKLVMRKLLGEAEFHQISRLHLMVDRTNARAIRLYRKFGFRAVESNCHPESYLMVRTAS